MAVVLPAIVLVIALLTGGHDSPSAIVFFASFCVALACVLPASSSELMPWVAYIASGMLFALVRPHADDIGLSAQLTYPISIDRWLFGGVLPTAWLQERLFEAGNIRPHDYFLFVTYVSHFLLPPWAMVAIWHLQRWVFSRFLTASILVLWLTVAGYLALPTVPPWLAGQQGEIEDVTKVTRQVAQQISPGQYEDTSGLVGENDVAAMPSLHFALPALLALAALRIGRLPGLVAGAYALTMGVALVYLGEHYVIDLLAGALVALVAWKAAAYVLAGIRELRERRTNPVTA